MVVQRIHQGGQVQVRRYECGREVTAHPSQTNIRDRLHYKLCDVCKNFKLDKTFVPKENTLDLTSSRTRKE
jgi:hypothetical protein